MLKFFFTVVILEVLQFILLVVVSKLLWQYVLKKPCYAWMNKTAMRRA